MFNRIRPRRAQQYWNIVMPVNSVNSSSSLGMAVLKNLPPIKPNLPDNSLTRTTSASSISNADSGNANVQALSELGANLDVQA